MQHAMVWCVQAFSAEQPNSPCSLLSSLTDTPGAGTNKGGTPASITSGCSITPQPGCLHAPPEPTSVIWVRGVKHHFKTRVSEIIGQAKQQQRGGASPLLPPPQFRVLFLVGPNSATLATATQGKQTGPGARLKHWHMVVRAVQLWGCSHPGQHCPGSTKDSEQAAGWGMKGAELPGHNPGHGTHPRAVWWTGASRGCEYNVQGTVSERGSVTAHSTPASGPWASCKSGPKERKWSSQHLRGSKQNVSNFLTDFDLAFLVVWCWHEVCFYKETF